ISARRTRLRNAISSSRSEVVSAPCLPPPSSMSAFFTQARSDVSVRSSSRAITPADLPIFSPSRTSRTHSALNSAVNDLRFRFIFEDSYRTLMRSWMSPKSWEDHFASTLGCGAGMEAECRDVGVGLQVQKQRLEVVKREIVESERQAAEARRQAQFQECRAVVASIKADATIAVAKCEEEHAVVQKCHAQNEAHTANSSILGCVGGILVAGATAGAGLPIALAGCGAGYVVGSNTTDDCPTSTCSHDPGLALAAAAKKQNRTSLCCGGMIGVSL